MGIDSRGGIYTSCGNRFTLASVNLFNAESNDCCLLVVHAAHNPVSAFTFIFVGHVAHFAAAVTFNFIIRAVAATIRSSPMCAGNGGERYCKRRESPTVRSLIV